MPRDVIVFRKPRFQKVFRLHENKKPALIRFQIPLVWRAFSKSTGLDSASENINFRTASRFHHLASIEDSSLATSLLLVLQRVRAKMLLLLYVAVR